MRENIKKRKELIDREIQIYYEEEKVKIDNQLIDLKTCGLEDYKAYEHTFHSTMEARKIELAKLEALEEVMKNDITTYKLLMVEKDKEIERMNQIVIALSQNQGVKLLK